MKKLLSIFVSLLVFLSLGMPMANAQELIDIPRVATLSGLNGHVTSADFSSNDQFIVTGGDNGVISVWNANNGTLVTQWQGTAAENGVQKVLYSPHNQMIASTDDNADIKLWDVMTGKLLATFDADQGDYGYRWPIYDVVFNHDGTILYSANGNRNSVDFWQVATGKKLMELTFPSQPLSLAYNSNSNQLVIGMADGSLNIINAETGTYIKAFPALIKNGNNAGYPDKLMFSPNYDYLYGLDRKRSQPYLFDAKSGYQTVTLDEGQYELTNKYGFLTDWSEFSLSHNNKYLALVNSDYQDNLAIFDSVTKQAVAVATAGDRPNSVAISHDNQLLIAGNTIFDISSLPDRESTGIKITTEKKDPEEMGLNDSQQLSVQAVYNDGTEEPIDASEVTWSSTNPTVAKIMYGKLYSYSAGQTTITASYGNFKSSIVVKAHDYQVLPKQTNVPADKTWEVTFSIPVGIQTVKEKNIFVTDEAGNVVPLLYYVENGKGSKVDLIPVKDYVSGDNYTLWVKEVKSENGQSLKQYTKMDFQIK